ncbi:MAG: DUF4922 domain-containing protein [Bacteroidaceae bacterium]|nr:DUF4922 domain-containing protein [Bacteroidaceae bacterium]
MKRNSIDIFVPQMAYDALQQFVSMPAVENIFLLSNGECSSVLPAKVKQLVVPSLTADDTFLKISAAAVSEFVIYFSKGLPQMQAADLEKFCASVPQDATMAYADYRKIAGGEVCEAPTIDYQAGSLRNDFDFGSVLLFRTAALKKYATDAVAEYAYAGLYRLRLAMSRFGKIFHYKEFLYTEQETDTRKSGEKQFDYVNPAQREVQIEMEDACTAHLKAIGGCLPACKYDDIDLSAGEFPVEASVIIPVLNRASTIGDAIKSVLGQQTTFAFNIIVVDNHSTDGTSEIIDAFGDDRVVHIIPTRTDLGIGGCWNEAVNSPSCGRFAVQLDSDDLYSSPATLQQIVDEFYKQQCAMLVGTYRICDFDLNTLPPGVIDHREWSEENGRNNALRINGLGAPRAFYTPVIRSVGFPNVSYGEDYAVGLQISRRYRIGRIYDVLYLCRRWGGNSDAALSHAKVNAHNTYKDSIRTAELQARLQLVKELAVPSLDELEDFYTKQLSQWPDAAARYDALQAVSVRSLGNGLSLQYNPARAVSTAAKVDAASLAARPCFLCGQNRPAAQQSLRAMGSLTVLVNPFPILPFHFTIVNEKHTPQKLNTLLADMLHLSRTWQGMAVFYNGAKCGASAPDHAHLQAVRAVDIPLLGEQWSEAVEDGLQPVYISSGSALYRVTGYVLPLFMVVADCVSGAVEFMNSLAAAIPVVNGECEPRMNVVSYYSPAQGYVLVVVPRAKHRPACYDAADDAQRLVSPGTLDMAGLLITPRECDYKNITPDEAAAILREVAIDDDAADDVCETIGDIL